MKQVVMAALIILEIFVVSIRENWDEVVYWMAKSYQKVFQVWQYNYYDIDNPQIVKKMSYNYKLFCDQAHYSDEMSHFLENIDELTPKPFYERKHTAVSMVTLNGKEYIVKYAWFRGVISNLLELNRGVAMWNTTKWAAEKGVPTITPVALIERRAWNRTETFFIYESRKRDGMAALEKEGKEILTPIYSLIYRMPETAVMHADLTPRNLVEGADGRFEYIDLDAFHAYPNVSYVYRQRFKAELKRFNRHVKTVIEHQARVAAENPAALPDRSRSERKRGKLA